MHLFSKKAGGWVRLCAAVAIALRFTTASAQTTVTNRFQDLDQAIPDGLATGLADSRTLVFTNDNFFQITNLHVTLTIEGGFNGDYYAYLVHEGGFAVLLNREGRTSANRHGYSHTGLDVAFDDHANDLHLYQSFSFELNSHGQLTGTWAPDGRRVDPGDVDENAPRSATLSSFEGLNPNGTWTLFLADLDYGEQGILKEWSVSITAVPEPGPLALASVAGGLAIFCWIGRKRSFFS